ncbi:MAG: DUF1700 domain-containing protein [Bacillota bacterium]
MNKEQYLSALRKALYANKVDDIDDIVSEYEEHFANKLSDGYPEEEIAAKLEKPEVIAKQFVPDTESDSPKRKRPNVFAIIGIVFLDIIMAILDIVLYAFVAVFGAAAVGLLAAGALVIAGGVIFPIPVMPAMGRVFLGVSILALSLPAAIGTIYYTMFVTQLNRAYCRWHKRVMSGRVSPPVSTTPRLHGKVKRRLRNIVLISLLAFVIAFVAAYVLLTVLAGAIEFWHVWRWFA